MSKRSAGSTSAKRKLYRSSRYTHVPPLEMYSAKFNVRNLVRSLVWIEFTSCLAFLSNLLWAAPCTKSHRKAESKRTTINGVVATSAAPLTTSYSEMYSSTRVGRSIML